MKHDSASPPPTALSFEEADVLLSISDAFIQEAVQMSRHYIGCSRHPSAIDATRWKRVAHVRDLTMYQERRGRARLGTKRKLGSRLAETDFPDDQTKLLPATLMLGTFIGDLESVMFGLQTLTEDATRLRASYLGDTYVDERLLAVPLEYPSYRDPLRSCTLKWRGLRRGAKVASGQFFSSRVTETVYIESSGVTVLSPGERIGYELLQSVDVPGFSGASKTEKPHAIISYCYVYRQASSNVVEVFMLGSTSRDGVSIGGAIAKMHSLDQLERCAELKKLAWLLKTSQPTLTNSQESGSCAECFRSFGRWPHRAERQCSVCDDHVCTSCIKYRHMRFALPDRLKIIRSKLAFCGRCVRRANETSPLTVATFDAMEHDDEFDLNTIESSSPLLSHGSKWGSQYLDDLAMTILGDL
ncbi:hypothetical protein CCR75_009340 [Bremia lactucae]|uniref:FYVE-type domain-containing protein n=1 Tax=Bremia lactucae TaxID=4779 RepID=A0A976FM76_BRELC|nr:hypothetical protein CCR75_009340 [Bremia lactucae]